MTITVIENIIMILGWSLFWIALAVYGGTISSRGYGEGRAILILSISGLVLMAVFPLYGQNDIASLIHSIVLFGLLGGLAFTFLSLRKKIR